MTTTSLYQAVHTFSLTKDQVDRSKENLEAALQTYERNIPTIKETVHRVSKRLREVHVALLQRGRIQKYRLEDHLTAEEVGEFNTITKMLGPFSRADISPVRQGTIFHIKENIYCNSDYSDSLGIGVTFIGMAAGLLTSAFIMDFKENSEFKYFLGSLAGLSGVVGISSVLSFGCKNHLPSFAGILEERAAYIIKNLPPK